VASFGAATRQIFFTCRRFSRVSYCRGVGQANARTALCSHEVSSRSAGSPSPLHFWRAGSEGWCPSAGGRSFGRFSNRGLFTPANPDSRPCCSQARQHTEPTTSCRLLGPKRRRSGDGDDNSKRPVVQRRRTTAKDLQRRVPGGGTAAEDGAGAAGTGAEPGAKDSGEEPAGPGEAVGVAASVGPRDGGQIAGAETAWGTRSSTPSASSDRAGFSDQGLDDQKFKLQRNWEPERAHQARPRGKLGKWARRDWLLNGYKVVLHPPPRVRRQKALPVAALNRTGMYVGNGACGRVEMGCLGGVAVALKFTDVREGLHDVAPLCNEVLKYTRLAALQGSVIPELVWSGWTGAGAVYGVGDEAYRGVDSWRGSPDARGARVVPAECRGWPAQDPRARSGAQRPVRAERARGRA
jgi:hypothetical protein